MAEQQGKQSWWQTLPGILTATAGIITAVTGFILAINQSGCFHKNAATEQQVYNDTIQKKPAQVSMPNEDTNKNNAVTKADDSVQAKPVQQNNGDTINLLSVDNGGQILNASAEDWSNTNDGKEDWAQLDNGIGQQAVYGFKDGKAATFNTFKMLIEETNDFNIKTFELLAGNDSPTGSFKSIGKFTTQNAKIFTNPYQEFRFTPTTAKYVKFKLISTFGWLHPGIHEFQLFGVLN